MQSSKNLKFLAKPLGLMSLGLALAACSSSGGDGGSASSSSTMSQSSSSSSMPSSSSSTSSSSSSSEQTLPLLTPLLAEAEGGEAATLNAQGADVEFVTETDGTIYATAAVDSGEAPADFADSRVVALGLSFPRAGEYQVYARVRVGSGAASDDSMFVYGSDGANTGWQVVNGITGYSSPGQSGYEEDAVVQRTGGNELTGVWKWALLDGVTLEVAANSLGQTFHYATREDGLDIDRFAFALLADDYAVGFTAADLESGSAGEQLYREPPPPAFEPPATQAPLAAGLDKFLGGVCCGSQRPYLENYFNQVTPENAGKWGEVEAVRDEFDWAAMDEAIELAEANGFPLRYHVLLWGNQQPDWIVDLSQEEQLAEIREWFAAVAERYGDRIDYLEVVNEFDNDPPDQNDQGGGNYIEALGGTGVTGYDWIVTAFELADEFFPATAKRMLNEYSVINTNDRTDRYIEVVELLQQNDLIDVIGVQGHAFSTETASAETMVNNINRLGATGLPVMVTELEVDGPPARQLAEFERFFPAIWENEHVLGVTLWGYRQGMWRDDFGATLVYGNGAEKPALRWLKGYLNGTTPRVDGPASVTISSDTAVGTSLGSYTARSNSGMPLTVSAGEIRWTVLDATVDGVSSDLLRSSIAFADGSGQLRLMRPLAPDTYTLQIAVDVDGVLSGGYEVMITVE